MVDLKEREDPLVDKTIKDAIENPHKYVLKPQKEGGGNNYFGEDMKQILIKDEGLDQFLLMEIIDAPILKTYMLRKGNLAYVDSITELGVFSMVIANSKTGEIIFNEVDGLLPRTKQADCNEGGVNAGFAVIDTMLPIDDISVSELEPSLSEVLKWRQKRLIE